MLSNRAIVKCFYVKVFKNRIGSQNRTNSRVYYLILHHNVCVIIE